MCNCEKCPNTKCPNAGKKEDPKQEEPELEALYVFFDFGDESQDPTYADADDAYIAVVSNHAKQGEDVNPCLAAKKIPCLPDTKEEIQDFADLMGWDVSFNAEGQMVLNAGIRV